MRRIGRDRIEGVTGDCEITIRHRGSGYNDAWNDTYERFYLVIGEPKGSDRPSRYKAINRDEWKCLVLILMLDEDKQD
jgi:hypothetical protein